MIFYLKDLVATNADAVDELIVHMFLGDLDIRPLVHWWQRKHLGELVFPVDCRSKVDPLAVVKVCCQNSRSVAGGGSEGGGGGEVEGAPEVVVQGVVGLLLRAPPAPPNIRLVPLITPICS